MKLPSASVPLFGAGLCVLVAGCTTVYGPADASGPGTPAGGGSTNVGGSSAAGGLPLGTAAFELPSPLVRRLTRDELSNSLEDALGQKLSEPDLTPVPLDRPLEGFVNTATSQTVSPEHASGYASVARAVAGRLNEGFVSAQGACQAVTPECQASFVAGVGKLLFRRPVDAEESSAFVGLFQVAVTEGTNFLEGARVVVEAMLQSPQFLYRLERETAAASGLSAGQIRPVIGYEMATRLSYMLWGSAPDAALMKAAEAGSLDTAAGVETELTRMLSDAKKGRRSTERFLTDWAKLEALPETPLRGELVSSLLAFYDDFIWNGRGGLLELFAAPHAFLTPTLAQNYGLVPMGDGIRQYDLTSSPGRRGLLTQPGLIAGMTNADGGAIVARGLFLQTQLFCLATPSPPTSLQDTIDAFVAEQPANASTRQIAEVRLARPACGACHQTFDPLAYGLEQFDFEGRYRQQDEFGNALKTDGWIPARFNETGENLAYQGVDDYVPLLAQSPAVGACLARQHLQYAVGRRLNSDADPLAAELYQAFAAKGGTYAAMLTVIAAQPLFRELKAE